MGTSKNLSKQSRNMCPKIMYQLYRQMRMEYLQMKSTIIMLVINFRMWLFLQISRNIWIGSRLSMSVLSSYFFLIKSPNITTCKIIQLNIGRSPVKTNSTGYSTNPSLVSRKEEQLVTIRHRSWPKERPIRNNTTPIATSMNPPRLTRRSTNQVQYNTKIEQ